MFEEVVPSAVDTEDKVASFLALSVADRSFKFEHSSIQEGSSTNAPMANGNDPAFILASF